MKNTNKSHVDFDNLQKAIIALEQKADAVNQSIKRSQAVNEVLVIQEKLVGDNVPVFILFYFILIIYF